MSTVLAGAMPRLTRCRDAAHRENDTAPTVDYEGYH
jgi:hypothetical protein